MEHIINITITESDDHNEVKGVLEYAGKVYTSSIIGDLDFTSDIFIPVFKQMGVELLCKALLHKDTFKLIVKYPDINDPYDGFIEGEVLEIEEK